MEGFGPLVLAVDELSSFGESTPGSNDVIWVEDRSIDGPSIRWSSGNGLIRNPASANFNGYPTIWRGNAGEFFDRSTGDDIVLSDMTFVMVLRPTNMGGSLAPFETQATSGGILIPTDGSVDVEAGTGAPLQVAPNGTIVVGTAHVIIVTQSIGSHAAGRVDGGAKVEPVGTPAGDVTIDRLSSSLSSTGDWEWAGLYLYADALSDSAVAAAGQYLSDKYALGQTW